MKVGRGFLGFNLEHACFRALREATLAPARLKLPEPAVTKRSASASHLVSEPPSTQYHSPRVLLVRPHTAAKTPASTPALTGLSLKAPTHCKESNTTPAILPR